MSTVVVSQHAGFVDDAVDRTLKRGHEEIATPTTPRPPASQSANTSECEPGITGSTPGPSQDNTTIPLAAASADAAPSATLSTQKNQRGLLYRGSSQSSIHSSAAVDDMDVDASDGDQDGSDNDTENGDGERSSKKKKAQRFFCTDFPPCNLSFTRSEHLARHIRKHTGERPFQCHCNRRFSRLDNLRQHAQTVHVNEEIPGDSLAATGTRFQRQIRTDRVRPAGGRPRSGTASSPSGHGRGHSRNLSTSSVGSTASNYSIGPEPRRRPPPLIMASDARPKLSLDPPITPPTQYRGYHTNSPGGFSTPTSTTYSNVPGSPSYGSNMESPSPNVSRSGSFFDPRTSARRLSVPSSANPYQTPYSMPYPQSYPSNYGPPNPAYSSQSSVYASPTSSTFSNTRMDNNTIPTDDWRRRTWHASTYTAMGLNYSRPATSGLTYSQTPDAPQPAFAQHATVAAGHAPRLPGIESFDHVQHRPSTPPRRQLSPMRAETGPTAHVFVTPNAPIRDHRRGHQSLDMSLNNNLTRLDIHGNLPKELTQWGQETMTEIQNAASRRVISGNLGQAGHGGGQILSGQPVLQPPAVISSAAPAASQRIRRHGWHNGPVAATRTSPEDSSSSEGVPTPGTSAAEIHPAIMHSSGYIEPHHPVLASDGSVNPCIPQQQTVASFPSSQSNGPPPLYYSNARDGGNDMGRLEALVAVATSEDKAATAAR